MKLLIALVFALTALTGVQFAQALEVHGVPHVNEYIWDFATDGGSDTVAIQLDAKAGNHKLPVGAVVSDETLMVETAATGTNSVYSLGNAASATAYHSSVTVATLVKDYVVKGVSSTPYKIIDSTYQDLKLTIGTQAATAGRVHFFLTYYY